MKTLKIIKNKFYFFKLRFIRLIRNFFEKKAAEQWNNYPFGNKIKGRKKVYLDLAIKAKNIHYPEIEAFEQNAGYQIDKNWLDELALHTQVVIKKSDICYAHGRILYSVLSNYISKNITLNNINIIETGTARGFSALCMAKALADNKKEGKIITFDVLPHDIKMFWNCIDDHNGPQSRKDLLSPWSKLVERYIVFHQGDTRIEMKKVKLQRTHFAFLDGFHTYPDVIYEYSQIRGLQKRGDIIVFDDYTPQQYPGLVKAVDEICSNDNYSKLIINSTNNRGYVIAEKK